MLPAYEEVGAHPATPPPPYSTLELAPQPADRPEECPHSAVSIPSDADAALPAAPEIMQTHLQSATTPNKDSIQSRYRRFTGDSGIVVCDDQQLWDQHGCLESEEEEEEGEEEEAGHMAVGSHHLCEMRNLGNTDVLTAVQADLQSPR